MTHKEKMKMLVEQWTQSGLTRKEFARQQGISVGTLDNWRKVFAVENTSKLAEMPSAAFIELNIGENPKPLLKAEIEFPGGIILKIY